MWSFSIRNSLDSCYFPTKFGAHLQKGFICTCMEKNFHSSYTFELMIHFLEEENFLNMHLDTPLNVTPVV